MPNMEEMSCGKRRCVKTSERFPQANPYTQTRVSFLKMFEKNGKCIEKYVINKINFTKRTKPKVQC